MIVAALLAVALQTAPSGTPRSPEHQAVLTPVNAVFAALAARDAAGLDSHFAPSAQLTVVHETADGANRISQLGWQDFAGGLQPGPERFEEVLIDPTIAIDGDIAVVWGSYVFRIDGQLSHCGVDHFGLVRKDGAWKITSLTWNQRDTGC
ncbi:MAG: DUF4440 domain-containing protein, partial [Brevundimonas sp.]